MADESLHAVPLDHNIDFHIVTLFERLEALRKDTNGNGVSSHRFSSTAISKRSMHAEIRTLEFWRSIISECLASFFYVFIVCGAAAGAGVGASVSSVLLSTALASGLAMATLTQCFLHISGAHINPAVTLAACVIRLISPMRAAMYVTAQCGGGIAGAALLYGVTVPGYQGNLQSAISHSASLPAWERFGVEFILTFVVVLSYFVSTDSLKKMMGNSAISIGAAYSACSFVSMPYLNPARSLGPSFVLNKWENHWVYWFGPLVGGISSAIIYEFIFNSRRSHRHSKSSIENESSSIHSEDDLNYDLDLDKPNMQNKFQGTFPRNGAVTGKSANSNAGNHNGGNFCQNLYTTPPPLSKLDHPEPIYGGTRSMYCRSPTLTRTNLNRSQSVYAKSNTAINRDIIPRSGPLVPAQSLYPIRVQPTQKTQSSYLQNQNVQNQLQQFSESIYGVRSSNRQPQQLHQHQQQQHHPPQQHLHQQQQQQQSQIQQNHVHQHQKQQQLQALTPSQQQIPQQEQTQPKQQTQQQQQQQQTQQQQSHQSMQQPQPVPSTQSTANQEHQQGFQPIYGTRLNSTPIDGNFKYDRRPESVYGHTAQRNRGQSAQSDDSSYGSYHGSLITPPARNAAGEPILMYAAPPSHHPQGHTLGTSQRTQSERKVTAPVVAGQMQQMPSTTISGTVTYPTSQQTTQQQQQQQQQHLSQHQQQQLQHQSSSSAQQHQQSQHYGMLPLRSN